MTEVVLEFESLDATLGHQILGHKPFPYERPDVSLILPYLKKRSHLPVSGIAILREGSGAAEVKKQKFARFLHKAGFHVVWVETTARRLGMTVSRDITDDVTDYVLKNSRAGIIIAGTHEQYAASALREQKARGAQVGILGYTDYISDRSAEVADFVLDLEYDLGVFGRPLPRPPRF